jgi:hypothetical protein
MKTKGILILLLSLALASCRSSNAPGCEKIPQRKFIDRGNYFVQATPGKDTLYLLEKDPTAFIIYRIWENDTVEVKPVICFVDMKKMIEIKKRCHEQTKEIN